MTEGGVGGYPPNAGQMGYIRTDPRMLRGIPRRPKTKREMSRTHAEKLERDRQRYRDNLEEGRARGRAFYVANREIILQTQRRRRLAFTQEQRDHYALYQREWRKKHREQLKASRRACYARDPQKEKIKQRRRYLRYREKRLKRMKQQRDARLSKEALLDNREYRPKAAQPVRAYKPRTHLRMPVQEIKPEKMGLAPYVPRPACRPYREKPRVTPPALPQENGGEAEKTKYCTSLFELVYDLFPSIIEAFDDNQ